jgi:hypothetical protein
MLPAGGPTNYHTFQSRAPPNSSATDTWLQVTDAQSLALALVAKFNYGAVYGQLVLKGTLGGAGFSLNVPKVADHTGKDFSIAISTCWLGLLLRHACNKTFFGVGSGKPDIRAELLTLPVAGGRHCGLKVRAEGSPSRSAFSPPLRFLTPANSNQAPCFLTKDRFS